MRTGIAMFCRFGLGTSLLELLFKDVLDVCTRLSRYQTIPLRYHRVRVIHLAMKYMTLLLEKIDTQHP